MKRFNLFLEDEVLAALAERSLVTGAPVAELMRRAVKAFLGVEDGPGYRASYSTPNRVPPQGGSSTAPAKKWTCKCGLAQLGGTFCGKCKEPRP